MLERGFLAEPPGSLLIMQDRTWPLKSQAAMLHGCYRGLGSAGMVQHVCQVVLPPTVATRLHHLHVSADGGTPSYRPNNTTLFALASALRHGVQVGEAADGSPTVAVFEPLPLPQGGDAPACRDKQVRGRKGARCGVGCRAFTLGGACGPVHPTRRARSCFS